MYGCSRLSIALLTGTKANSGRLQSGTDSGWWNTKKRGKGGVEGKLTVVSDPRTRETHDVVEVVVIVWDDTLAKDAGPITT